MSEGGGNEQEEDEILLPTDYSRYEVAAGSSGAILPPFGRGGSGRKETKWTMLFPPAQSAADLHAEEFYHAQERTTTVRQAKALSTHAGHFCINSFCFPPLGSCLLKGCLKKLY